MRFGADPASMFDPSANMAVGAAYLKVLQRQFGNDVRLVLAAYNAGEGAVQRHGGVPPYAETTSYVSKVLKLYDQIRSATGVD
jgi:lysozyme